MFKEITVTTDEMAISERLLAARVRIPRHVVYRAFPSETVILNLDTGKYHGVNPTGGRMLDSVVKADHVRAAAATLAEELEQPLARVTVDLCAFCGDLARRGLIDVTYPSAGA